MKKKTANRPTIYREQRQLGKIQSPQFPEKEKKLKGASVKVTWSLLLLGLYWRVLPIFWQRNKGELSRHINRNKTAPTGNIFAAKI